MAPAELYRVEYRDPRGRWHRARGGFELASAAVDRGRELMQRGDVHGWRVVDATGAVVASSQEFMREARRVAAAIATGAVRETARADSPAELEARYRGRLAELEVLQRFAELRRAAGYDYGSGQRGAELMRRRRELAELRRELERLGDNYAPWSNELGAAELGAAFARIGAPKLRRARRELARFWGPGASSAPTARTVQTWERLEARIARELEAPAPSSRRAPRISAELEGSSMPRAFEGEGS